MKNNEVEIRTDISEGRAIATVRGEVDSVNSPLFRREMLYFIRRNDIDELVIDFSTTIFIDSDCLGALIRIWKEAADLGKSLKIVSMNGTAVRRQFATPGFDRVIPFFEEIREAIAAPFAAIKVAEPAAA